jgi:endonuclease III
MKIATRILLLVLLVSVAASARRRDPLTEAEADQLREVATEPYKRLKLLIKFTEARLVAIDQVRVDPKLAKERGKQIHDLLEDFTALLDEINDNLDQYQGRPLNKDDRKDFKKGLKELIEADERFDLKLRTLQSATQTDTEARKDYPDFRFVLQDAQEALKSNADMAREYIEETPAEKKK